MCRSPLCQPPFASWRKILGRQSSTVDIAHEFTSLLTFERGYQANSRVITTENQILQQTVSLVQP